MRTPISAHTSPLMRKTLAKTQSREIGRYSQQIRCAVETVAAAGHANIHHQTQPASEMVRKGNILSGSPVQTIQTRDMATTTNTGGTAASNNIVPLQPYTSCLHNNSFAAQIAMPKYMNDVYWWAYLEPWSPKIFDHPIVVNAILWGNYNRLRDAAVKEVPRDPKVPKKALQVACAYGSVTPALFDALDESAHLEIVDISPIQLDIVARKVDKFQRAANRRGLQTTQPVESTPSAQVFYQSDYAKTIGNQVSQRKSLTLRLGDAANMECYESHTFGFVLSFFLLHEVPKDVRMKIVREAFRVAAPGAKLVFVDYHEPTNLNPVKPIMKLVNQYLEPFAEDLWEHEIDTFIDPAQAQRIASRTKETYFGGLYQKVVYQLKSE